MNYVALVSLALVGAACAAPNHLKHVSVEKQVAVNSGGNLGASASWGPYSAGASLGEGGASAGAFAPGAAAGAGIGGASASAGAGSSSGAVSGANGGPTFFDQIFNIPISVLKSVNDHLNNKETVPGAHAATHAARRLRKCQRRGNCPAEGVSVTSHGSAGSGASASAGAQASTSADASSNVDTRTADASAGVHTGSGAQTVTVRKNYDNVFAIPISALTSVNQLLNGK